MARATDDIGWLQDHQLDHGLHQRALTTLESKAEQVIQVAQVVIPEQLQTTEYTKALGAESGPGPKNDIDDGKVTRLPRRSELKRRKQPQRVVLVDESLLHQPLAGREVLRRQLEHLRGAAAQSHWSIRIVPSDHKITAEAFTMLRFPERSPVVYVEHLTCGLFLEQPHDIDAYEQVLNRLDQNALDESDSLEVLARMTKGQSWRPASCPPS